jgi:hypothetical protein
MCDEPSAFEQMFDTVRPMSPVHPVPNVMGVAPARWPLTARRAQIKSRSATALDNLVLPLSTAIYPGLG